MHKPEPRTGRQVARVPGSLDDPDSDVQDGFDRLDTDEAAAADVRVRYREHGLEPIAPGDCIAARLDEDEHLLAVVPAVVMVRRLARPGEDEQLRGDLYVTSRRLLHVSLFNRTIELDEIEDAALSGTNVLLLLRGGLGVVLRTSSPRLVRARIAVARAARGAPAGEDVRAP
ncbi:MAG: hypothetical protein EPO36_03840 [Chloroflexota bacterium]|nr:MAG: hypothetical protein EPO36_03840 [Chloroflexota bacterium]